MPRSGRPYFMPAHEPHAATAAPRCADRPKRFGFLPRPKAPATAAGSHDHDHHGAHDHGDGGPAADGTVATSDPLGLFRALEANERFRRDTQLGGIFHHGKISFREVSPTDSLHVIIDGNRVSAHIDDISPLNCDPDGPSHYKWARVLAHNVSGAVSDVTRVLRGQRRRPRCNLECEMVWVDDDEPLDGLLHGGHEGELEPSVEEDKPRDDVPPAGPLRAPFGLVDEAVHLLDTEAAPWSIQLEVRVSGRLDEERLRRALQAAMSAHPMARARKVASRKSLARDTWEVPDEPELDPLRVIDCPDEAALSAAREALLGMAVPLAESPPLRARLVRQPDGDVLMLNVNHAAMDGFGALRVLQSITRAYAGTADPAPELGFLEMRELPVRLDNAAPPTPGRRLAGAVAKVRDIVVPLARVAPDGDTGEAGYGFCHVSLSPEQTAALQTLPDGSVTDALLAALHNAVAAWNEEHGARCRRIGVLVPANLRPGYWSDDMVGNFCLPARVSTTPGDRTSPATCLQVVSQQSGRDRPPGIGAALLQFFDRSRLFPLWAKEATVLLLPLTGNRLIDTAMLANLGEVADPPSFGPDAGETVGTWFSAPARMPLGLSIGALTTGGRVHLSFRYRHRLFGEQAAARFVDRYLAELGHFTDPT